MAFQRLDRQPVEVQISNGQFGPFVVARRVHLVAQHYELGYDNQASLLLELDVRSYALQADGSAGELIATIPPRRCTIGAANDTLVDAQSGEVLAVCPPYPDPAGLPEAWQAKVAELSQDRATMLQGDFFAQLAENVPVRFNDLIRQHIRLADALGRFQ